MTYIKDDLLLLLCFITCVCYSSNAWETTNSQWLLGQDITNSTVGIIGLGGIGQTIAKRLKGFNVKEVLYTGHREKTEGMDYLLIK